VCPALDALEADKVCWGFRVGETGIDAGEVLAFVDEISRSRQNGRIDIDEGQQLHDLLEARKPMVC
jgi:hypothetical protein